MNEVFAAALALQAFCESQNWQFCFIGGIAIQRWGEPRFTDDADLTLLTGFGGEERYIRALLGHFSGRRSDAAEFALRHRVLLLKDRNGVPLDVALGAFPFEVACVQRASPYCFPVGQSLITCSAEDLLVHKAFASRDLDWHDVEGVLIRQWGRLDLALVRRELRPLAELKEEPEILDRLERLLAKLGRSPTLSKLQRQPGG